jgi:hypothetical protein
MYVVIWEYQVRAESLTAFEELYSATGAWAILFQKSRSYLGTELLCDPGPPRRYLTIDRWVSQQDYEAFLGEWRPEYETLDARCEALTDRETLIGKCETMH